MDSDRQKELEKIATQIRSKVLELTLAKNGCYLSQALSSAEMFATLYGHSLNLASLEEPLTAPAFTGVPGTPNPSPSGGRFHGEKGEQYDRLLISPAHYAVAVYAALEAVGRLEDGAFLTFNEDGSTLEQIGAEHSPGFELTTGSFGQAISQGAGIALSRRIRKESGRTFVFVSDGELEEGQTWEAIQAAAHFQLDKLVVLVDVNGQQYDGATKDVMDIEPITDRVSAFRWEYRRVDGHDCQAIAEAIDCEHDGKPLMVLCDTDTTKGIPYLDYRKPHLHYVRPKSEEDYLELKKALVEMKEMTE